MKPIRAIIMARKLHRSSTTCVSCWRHHAWQRKPLKVPCTRLSILVGGRLYQHWVCEACQRRIWGNLFCVCTLPPFSPLTELDRLIEQQDQEMLQDGCVSPFTIQQLQAYREGRPIPHLDLHTPEMEQATASVLHAFKSFRLWQADPAIHSDDLCFDTDDNLWCDDENESE